jgi:hypothetical protein
MRSAITVKDTPSRVQRLILSRMLMGQNSLEVGTAVRATVVPLCVPDYGEALG